MDTSRIIHLLDNSHDNKPQLHPGGAGWSDYLAQQARPVIDALGVRHVMIRQPFPTPATKHREPLWFTGYTRAKNNDRRELWSTYVDAVNDLKRDTGIEWWAYLGHLGGDTNPSDLPADRIPWHPDPLLAEALADPNRFRGLIDDNLTPHDHVGAHVMFDAQARTDAESPYFAAMELYRRTAQAAGRHVGVEGPPHPGYDHLKPFCCGAVWSNYQACKRTGYWSQLTGPRVVFCRPDAAEVREVVEGGDYAAVSLLTPMRAGHVSLEAWLSA